MTKSLFLVLLIGSTTAFANSNSCSIEAGWVDCGGAQSFFDRGCSVTCKEGKPVCTEAVGFPALNGANPLPEPYTPCNSFPSYCDCE